MPGEGGGVGFRGEAPNGKVSHSRCVRAILAADSAKPCLFGRDKVQLAAAVSGELRGGLLR
eukprot:65116-Alexandrium_andersonii.AAC.1